MAGEKAKENKTLTSKCAGCGKELSVELLSGHTVGAGRERRLIPLCDSCDRTFDPRDFGPEART